MHFGYKQCNAEEGVYYPAVVTRNANTEGRGTLGRKTLRCVNATFKLAAGEDTTYALVTANSVDAIEPSG